MPNSKRFRARRILGAVICLLLAAQLRSAALVSAQPGIRGPARASQTTPLREVLSDERMGLDSEEPDIATCADGSIHVVWTEEIPPGSTQTAEEGLDETQIWYRRWDPEAGWNEPGPVTYPLVATGSQPAIATDYGADGGCTLHLVWTKTWFGGYAEIFATYNDGTGFETPSTVSRTDAAHSSQPDIAIMPDGTPHVVWVEGTDYKIYEGWPNLLYPGKWDKVRVPDAKGQVPALAIDHTGRLHLAWMALAESYRDPPDVNYKRQVEPGEWEVGWDNLSYPAHQFQSRLPAITVSSDKVGVAWQEETAAGPYDVLFAWRPLDNPYSPFLSAYSLSASDDSDANSGAPAITTDRFGTFYAVWDEGKPVHALLTRRWAGMGDWWPDEKVSDVATNIKQPAVAASGDSDHVYAVWAQEDRPDDKLDIYFSELKTYDSYLTLIADQHHSGGSGP